MSLARHIREHLILGVGTTELSDDTTPQLGGNLDVNGNSIGNGGSAVTFTDHVQLPDGGQFGYSGDTDTYFGRISANKLGIYTISTPRISIENGAVAIGSNNSLSWASTVAASGARDVSLYRDAANTLALRNSTNNQEFRIYETNAGGSEIYLRLRSDGANGFKIDATGGAGTDRDLVFNGANRVSKISDVSSGTDATYETAINAIIDALEAFGLAATS